VLSFPFLPLAERKRNANEKAQQHSTGTETETTQATQGRNGTKRRKEGTKQDERPTAGRIPTGRKPEQEGGKCTFLLPSFLPSLLPVFRPFPVCLRATIKTIFPPLRYVYAHFEKKVKKYL